VCGASFLKNGRGVSANEGVFFVKRLWMGCTSYDMMDPSKEENVMDNHPRRCKPYRDVKVNRIPRGNNILIVTDCKREQKENATKPVDKLR